MNDALEQFLDWHAQTCDLGVRNCADCALYRDRAARHALATARSEHAAIAGWIDHHPDACVYCGDYATHVDHLVPRPWTGNAVRRFVPTVPACADCNTRIGAAHVFTIAGRAEVSAESLHRRHRRQLRIPDRSDVELDEYDGAMRHNIRAAQVRRQHLRRRLMVLDAGGAPFVPTALVVAA